MCTLFALLHDTDLLPEELCTRRGKDEPNKQYPHKKCQSAAEQQRMHQAGLSLGPDEYYPSNKSP